MGKILNIPLMRHNEHAAKTYAGLSNESGTAIFAVFSHDVNDPTRVSVFWEKDAPVDHVIKSLETALNTLRHMNRNVGRNDDLSGLKVSE